MHEYFFKTLQLLRIFKNTVNIYFRMVHHNPRQRKYLNISYGSAVYITSVWEESFSLKQLCMMTQTQKDEIKVKNTNSGFLFSNLN